MKYTTAIQILENGQPRTVASKKYGDLRQYFVHSWDEMMLFFDENIGEANLYMNIARFRPDMRPITGDFPFDFDSPMKESAFSDDINDAEKIRRMRKDEELAEEVLGSVWDDAQKLVSECWDRGIPVVSVFSGMGVHCHLLFQEQVNPTEEKTTTSQHLIEELDLDTYDRKIVPDTKRVLRVPNSKRIDDGVDCGVYCIPMTELEVMNNSLHDMLERCSEPKDIKYFERYEVENRPEMQVYDDVEVDSGTVGTVELDDRDISREVPDDVKHIVEDSIGLPCVRERFLRSNPDHHIRLNGVIWLYQSGYTPGEVRDIIAKVGWVDYNESITRKMTDQIWKRQYSESSCGKLQSLGLCVYGPEFGEFDDDPKECETHRYTSGKSLYPY